MEEWREVVEGYQVSNRGRVKSFKKNKVIGKVIHPIMNNRGYFCVELRPSTNIRNNCLVHRLVAQAFLPNYSNDLDVHHTNGVKTDNRVENLQMISRADHTSIHHRGELANSAKLTVDQVAKIKILLSQGALSQRDIAKMYGVSKTCIGYIHGGRNWKHVK